MRKKVAIFLLIIFIAYGLPLTVVMAQEFNPNYIISDAEMTDYNSMGMFEIIQFIKNKGGTLYSAKFEDADGKIKSAPALIYNNSQEYKINPKVMLVTLQKEQSLIDNPKPSQYNYDWATGWAVCDGCSLSDPKVAKYKGFAKQIDGAAGGYRWYIDQFEAGENSWLIEPNEKKIIDETEVTPSNKATAALYNYTPHLHGNENFWKLWNKWFAISYPDGTLLQAEAEDTVWLIQKGSRRPFKSKAALLASFDLKNIIIVSKTEIEKYPQGKEIKFANYSLLRSPAGTIYLLVDDKLRGIKSMEVFKTIGFNRDEVLDVAAEDIRSYEEAEPITMESAYPSGALLQNKTSGGIYFVKNGVKQPIVDKIIMSINFKNWKFTRVSADELTKYQNGFPVTVKDGLLIKSKEESAIYFISEGKRRPIANKETFEKIGFKWSNVQTVPQKVVNVHPLGEVINVSY